MEIVPALTQPYPIAPDADTMPAPIDFGMLRAGLLAAQSATPTARATARAKIPDGQVAALHALLGDLVRDDGRQSWLHGRFSEIRPFSSDESL